MKMNAFVLKKNRETAMRRVVVTGLGLVTPVGAEVELAWANIKAGKSGAARIRRKAASRLTEIT